MRAPFNISKYIMKVMPPTQFILTPMDLWSGFLTKYEWNMMIKYFYTFITLMLVHK